MGTVLTGRVYGKSSEDFLGNGISVVISWTTTSRMLVEKVVGRVYRKPSNLVEILHTWIYQHSTQTCHLEMNGLNSGRAGTLSTIRIVICFNYIALQFTHIEFDTLKFFTHQMYASRHEPAQEDT